MRWGLRSGSVYENPAEQRILWMLPVKRAHTDPPAIMMYKRRSRQPQFPFRFVFILHAYARLSARQENRTHLTLLLGEGGGVRFSLPRSRLTHKAWTKLKEISTEGKIEVL